MTIADILKPENVVIDVPALPKPRLIHSLARMVAERLGVDEAAIYAALNGREQLGSTGIGSGVAIPHATIDAISAPFVLAVRLTEPVDYEATDDVPVDLIFVILVPEKKAATHLNVLSSIAKRVRSQPFLTSLREAETSEALFGLITNS